MRNNQYHQFFHFGIKGKLSLLILFSSLLPFILIGYYSHYSTTQLLTENILANNKQQVEDISHALFDVLAVVPTHLQFLADFYALNQFLQKRGEANNTQQWLKNTLETFHSFMAYQKIYSQLQVISPMGQELLCIDYDHFQDKTIITPDNELQNRQYIDYFTNTINLKKGEIYRQPLYDEKSQNVQNVIRYSIPIVEQKNISHGVLVLSLYADTFLDRLRQASENDLNHTNAHYLLINHTGNYLYDSHNKGHKLEFGHQVSFKQKSLASVMVNKQQGTITTNGIITSFQRLYPLNGATDYWVVIKQIHETVTWANVHHFKYMFFAALIVIMIWVLFIIHRMTKTVINPLLLVNWHLKTLARGQIVEDNIQHKGTDEIGELVTSTWQLKNSIKNTIAQANAIAAGNYSSEIKLLSQQDQLGQTLSNMTHTLREVTNKNAMQDWLKTGQTQLNEKMSGEQDLAMLARNIIHLLTTCLQASVGLLYLVEEDKPVQSQNSRLKLMASYAYVRRKNLANEFQLGEGLVGQAALERQSILITQVPEDYIHIQSGLGEAVPQNIIVMPFMYEKVLKGVIEIGSLNTLTDIHLEFLNQVIPSIGIAINTAQSRTQMHALLQQTQAQAEELQSQAEELESQQEELRQANEELEEQTQVLEKQKDEVRDKNITLEKTQKTIENKAKELELASKYKSEFLANMSHELRTPLNSLLILSQLLNDNKAGNLSEKQVEYARTIHSAGSDLLMLINDILDLSKVEAGKMEVQAENVSLIDLVEAIKQKFQPIAETKGLAFHSTFAENVPPVLYTDGQRLRQILNNLLSNAFKFTEQGEIKLIVQPLSESTLIGEKADCLDERIIIRVEDTGVGIPKDKQKAIFEAFQQVDGTTSRRYGGTGLGLSISRQLAQLLGGELKLESEEGKGSIFILSLPELKDKNALHLSELGVQKSETANFPQKIDESPAVISSSETLDENATQVVHDKTAMLKNKKVLIVDDDVRNVFALATVLEDNDMEIVVAQNGLEALSLLEEHEDIALILMDIMMPEMDGFETMRKLRSQKSTSQLPIIALTAKAMKGDKAKCIEAGANDYLSKPVDNDKLLSLMRVWLYR